MSCWTYINQIVIVDASWLMKDKINDLEYPLRQSELDKAVQDAIDKAPAITGSECDAAVFVNRERNSHNLSMNRYNRSNNPAWRKYNTEYVLTVHGSLRDRTYDETSREWERFKRYMKKTFDPLMVKFPTDANEKKED